MKTRDCLTDAFSKQKAAGQLSMSPRPPRGAGGRGSRRKLVATFNARMEASDAKERAEAAKAGGDSSGDLDRVVETATGVQWVNALFDAGGAQKNWETLMVLPPGCMVHKTAPA